jgi:hypothetical protein
VLSRPAPRSTTFNVSDNPSTQIQRVRLAHDPPPNTVNHDLPPFGIPLCDS